MLLNFQQCPGSVVSLLSKQITEVWMMNKISVYCFPKHKDARESDGEKISYKCQSECYKQYRILSNKLTFKFWYHWSSWKKCARKNTICRATCAKRSILDIMLICLNDVPKFLTRLILISKLTSPFLFEQIELTVQAISSVPADVKTILCDGNRLNQAFLIFFLHYLKKIWIIENKKHLTFVYVHLLKNIRYLWFIEKTNELIFGNNGVKRIAKWVHLKQLCLFCI